MKDKPGFCYEIFKNIAFWSDANGVSYNPCSFYNGFVDSNISADKAWFGPNHKKIIDIVNQGKLVPGCSGCYKEESAGRKSRRQSSAELYNVFFNGSSPENITLGPSGLDYSIGNWCNLKCIICGPHSSSSWISDYQKIYPDQKVDSFVNRKSNILEIDDDSFLSNIKSLHFHGGGEPLLGQAHVRLLERVDKVKGLSDVRVFYNTNGTVIVDDSLLDLWSKCRLVELYFSIDDIGSRFDYQRTGAQWNNVVDNIKWYYNNMPHNHMFNINCVWSYLNLFYLDELYNWYQANLPTNRYGDPCNLIFQKAIGNFGITHLDPIALGTLRNKFKHIPDLLLLLNNIVENSLPHTLFWNSIEKIDSVRGANFRNICPEWSAYL
jgi:hypothetical protein